MLSEKNKRPEERRFAMRATRKAATLQRRLARFGSLAAAAVILTIAASTASAHTSQGNATPSNAGSGHPWASNGCTWSRDSQKGLFDFKHACDHHDGCYTGFPRNGTPTYWASKERCDQWFRDDMRASCREQHPPRPTGQPFSNRETCLEVASVYYGFVDRFGGPWYKKPDFVEPGRPKPGISYPIPQLPQLDFPTIHPIAPIPTPSPGTAGRGYHIEDVFLGGTWARTDPNNGAWYGRNNRPANGAYWYANGLGVGVDCARAAAHYVVTWADGHKETWNTWFHVTDGKWYPSAASREILTNGSHGLRGC